MKFLFFYFYNGRRSGLSDAFGEVFCGLEGEKESDGIGNDRI